MIFIKNYINKKDSLQNVETIHNDWKIEYIHFLNYPMIPNNIIDYFGLTYSSNLYLYNYYINDSVFYILAWWQGQGQYQYTPQILDNILMQNDYIDIYTNNIFVISLYHHLVLIKYTNINIDNNAYYLGLYFNHHLYETNIYWNENKQFCSNNNKNNLHEIHYNLILNHQYINSKINELNCLIKAKELLNKL